METLRGIYLVGRLTEKTGEQRTEKKGTQKREDTVKTNREDELTENAFFFQIVSAQTYKRTITDTGSGKTNRATNTQQLSEPRHMLADAQTDRFTHRRTNKETAQGGRQRQKNATEGIVIFLPL